MNDHQLGMKLVGAMNAVYPELETPATDRTHIARVVQILRHWKIDVIDERPPPRLDQNVARHYRVDMVGEGEMMLELKRCDDGQNIIVC